jgi:chromosomal replication initiator protein
MDAFRGIQIESVVLNSLLGSDFKNPKSLRVKWAISKVCAELGIDEKELKSKTRKREICEPRQMIMASLRMRTTLALASIGNALGGKDHATVLHASRTVEALSEVDKLYEQRFHQIDELIKSVI